MYGISVWPSSYLLPPYRREAHVEKNVTLFSYMVMQHAAHLEIYPPGAWPGARPARTAGTEDWWGARFAYTVLWELRKLPHRWTVSLANLRDIFVLLACKMLPRARLRGASSSTGTFCLRIRAGPGGIDRFLDICRRIRCKRFLPARRICEELPV